MTTTTIKPSRPNSTRGSAGWNYLSPAVESEENLRLMRLIDEQYPKTPFYGRRRMAAILERRGESVNRKRVQRLMALMGLEGLHPRPRTSVAGPDGRADPYLLRDRVLTRVDEVWSSDITYMPMSHGFTYLAAVVDWYSRYVLSWRPSNTPDGGFSLESLDEALGRGRPEIFNTDQGLAVHLAGEHRPPGRRPGSR